MARWMAGIEWDTRSPTAPYALTLMVGGSTAATGDAGTNERQRVAATAMRRVDTAFPGQGNRPARAACYTISVKNWLAESFGTLVGAVLLAVGLFVLFVGMGLAPHLPFAVVLKPGAPPAYVVGTAIAATLIVAAGVLILWAFGVRLSHLPAWRRRRRGGGGPRRGAGP